MEQQSFDFNQLVVDAKAIKKKHHNLFVQIISDFAENTTLSGLKYMTGKGVSVMGKIFWISMFVLSIIISSWMVYNTYLQWQEKSVIISVMDRLVNVNEVPFPAVTICPEAKIRQKYYNYTEAYVENFDLNDFNMTFSNIKFHSTVVLCNGMTFWPGDLQNTYTDINTFFEVSPKVEDVLANCIWRNRYGCHDAFHPVLTAEGVCFTFNSLAADEIFRKNSVHQQHLYINTTVSQNGWSLYRNYESKRTSKHVYPARGRGNGAHEDLLIVLKEITDRDFICEGHTRAGYKVYLHHPADLPQASLHYYAAHPERTTSLALNLDILGTSDELPAFSPNFRQCYFPLERSLMFFKNYTSKNCQLECLTNYTLRKCGCVKFHMPRNSSVDICKVNQMRCVDGALDDYAESNDAGDSIVSQCNCLPSCYEINYGAETVITKFDQKEYYKKLEVLKCLANYLMQMDDEDNEKDNTDTKSDDDATNVDKSQTDKAKNTTEFNSIDVKNLSKETITHNSGPDCEINDKTEIDSKKTTQIRMYYRRSQFVAMQRSEMFGKSQFLADAVGSLGFFLGFSFITLAEIFYFTLKLCCRQRQKCK